MVEPRSFEDVARDVEVLDMTDDTTAAMDCTTANLNSTVEDAGAEFTVDADDVVIASEAVGIPPNSIDRIEEYPGAARPIRDIPLKFSDKTTPQNPWHPFASAEDFEMAKWFLDGDVPNRKIDDYFRGSMGRTSMYSFSSAHTLFQSIDRMDQCLGWGSWKTGTVQLWSGTEPYFYRDPVDIVRYLLRQKVFAKDFAYAPARHYSSDDERVYSDMHTADAWWELQVWECVRRPVMYADPYLIGQAADWGHGRTDHIDVRRDPPYQLFRRQEDVANLHDNWQHSRPRSRRAVAPCFSTASTASDSAKDGYSLGRGG